jgi:hypothetical protein
MVAGGWYPCDNKKDGMILWWDDTMFDRLCKMYNVTEDTAVCLTVDALVSRGKFGESARYQSEPWIVLRPEHEDVCDGVSMGQVFGVYDGLSDAFLGYAPLCWEGLIQAFEVKEPGELYVYLPKWAQLPARATVIEEDYA